jgi:hypothetical protein
MVVGDIACEASDANWANEVLKVFPKYAAEIQLKYMHSFNPKHGLTQFAILFRFHTWTTSSAIINKNPKLLLNTDIIWDKFIKHEFESSPTTDKLLSACSLLGFRCVSCGRVGFPLVLCQTPACVTSQISSSSKNGGGTKSPLDEEFKSWCLLPDSTTLLASKPKNFKKWEHFFNTIASKAQRDAHLKIRNSSSPSSSSFSKFSSFSKCLNHFVSNQNEIPLLGNFDHSSLIK